eukprot:7389680-Prymnesium_polylepis.3
MPSGYTVKVRTRLAESRYCTPARTREVHARHLSVGTISSRPESCRPQSRRRRGVSATAPTRYPADCAQSV